ncbi:MAG: multifunctional oxoglutarate decarboxylase/oxoglutarate dehydrogenase thiamine pyrophosphate-binding subunit/dihydrolipoyllysine-residue succinyltransferase subunit, partial [bacterium]|nr:multifunctional oxoglutarate decarboxylase/oxoglutarate dehydrogenase thiamine pyrophosphate-binding subunit/dihydrolipoyllysine-residue succinyltransferase subunit [bacterium]
VIPDSGETPADRIARLLLCSGKVYYDLIEARQRRDAGNVAIVSLEQLYPFPGEQLRELIGGYSATIEVVWVQEEPVNMGPWRFVREQIQPLLDPSKRTLRYAGRAESASPATGSYKRHLEELAEVLEAAFTTGPVTRKRRVRVRRKRSTS